MTNNDFIREKLSNFIAYAKESLKGHKSAGIREKFYKKLDDLAAVDITVFIAAVVEKMAPYAKDPRAYVLKLIGENDLQEADFTPDQMAKLTRYVTLFIDVVSS